MSQSEAVVEQPDQRDALIDEVPPKDWKHNFVANFLDVSFFSLGLAFASLSTIIPLYIRQLGGSTLLVGLVPAIVQTGWMLPPLFAAHYITRLERKLPFLLRMTLGERLPWLILAGASVALVPGRPELMLAVTIGLLAIFGLAGGVCTPAWMDIVARVTPLRMRGKLFGWSGAMSGILGVAGGLLAERVLARYAFPLNFALCFLAAGICMFISFAALAMLREPAAQEEAQRTSVADYVRNLPAILRRDRDFTAFIVSRVLTALGGMAIALVAIYAAEERGLPESLAGRFTAVMLGTQVITTPLWGMIGDRRGHKWPLQFGLFCQALAMALVLVVSTPLGFYVVFSLIGASAGLLFTTTLNIVVEFAPAAERVTYLGLHGTLIAPATLIAPLFGGWLADKVSYAAAFATAAVCGFIGFAILSWFVRDPRWRQLAAAQARSAAQGAST